MYAPPASVAVRSVTIHRRKIHARRRVFHDMGNVKGRAGGVAQVMTLCGHWEIPGRTVREDAAPRVEAILCPKCFGG